ncbi:MAG: sensor histidine kinase, partial [Spirochaetota bacterium]
RKYDENAPNLHSIIKSGTETIIEEVDILRHILGEFSKYTRMPEPSREYNSINQIIQNSCNTFQGHENITFSLHLDDDIPDIFVDRILIRQMMHNIIKNAIEAMSGAGTVFIRSRLDGDMVEIRIADTGPGISREDIDHLFDTTFSRKSDGTGLGLAIVERTVVKHGGTIECSSVPGRGAEFIIRLPAQGRDNGTGSDS